MVPSDNATSVFGANSGFNGITWNGSRFVVVGHNPSGYIGYSSDGINWTKAVTDGTIFSFSNAYSVAWNGKRFVAVGYGGTTKIGYSFDGITWVASDNGNSVFTGDVYGVGGGNPNFGPVPINSTLTFKSEDRLTFNVDIFNSNVNDI